MRNEPKPDRHLLPRYQSEPIQIPVVVIEETETFSVTVATAGGDEQKLRGIPAVRSGKPGAIRGTVPHAIKEVA